MGYLEAISSPLFDIARCAAQTLHRAAFTPQGPLPAGESPFAEGDEVHPQHTTHNDCTTRTKEGDLEWTVKRVRADTQLYHFFLLELDRDDQRPDKMPDLPLYPELAAYCKTGQEGEMGVSCAGAAVSCCRVPP